MHDLLQLILYFLFFCSVANDRICLKCKNRCNLIQLDSGTRPDIKMYFEPLDKLILKLQKIEKFQRTQREHLFKHLTSEVSFNYNFTTGYTEEMTNYICVLSTVIKRKSSSRKMGEKDVRSEKGNKSPSFQTQ